MCKGLVGLRHLVHFIALANGVALPLVSLQDLRARASFIGIPFRPSAKSTSQRKARANCLSVGTSSGTW